LINWVQGVRSLHAEAVLQQMQRRRFAASHRPSCTSAKRILPKPPHL